MTEPGPFPIHIPEAQGLRVALVIGNGVNLYDSEPKNTDSKPNNSWLEIIQALAKTHQLNFGPHTSNLALTEVYDLIDLKVTKKSEVSLQREFAARMKDWKPQPHHRRIAQWAIDRDVPILTTNFDTLLAEAVDATLNSLFQKNGSLRAPTDFYPWEKYFACDPVRAPCESFGIWHMNGLANHSRSIRLGLTHYMGSVSRARPWLHGDKESRLFGGKNQHNWRGRNTWLDIVFNMPLVIFGLQLGAQEVLLRWLLIERARYFENSHGPRLPAWYVYPAWEQSDADRAKYFFLENIGVKPVAVPNYDDIYGPKAWNGAV